MRIEITIYADGSVSEPSATVHPGVEVVWIADGRAFDFTVRFVGRIPFAGAEWRDREETGTMQTNREVHGTIKEHGSGKHSPYSYVVNPDRNLAPASGPVLIVDGGPGFRKKKSKKVKKTKRGKKGNKTKKSRAAKKR
jgi:hypothetical protein